MISEYFVWLSELCGAGSPLPKRLYRAFDGDLRSAYEAEYEEYKALGFSESEAELFCDKDFSRANGIIDYCAQNRVGILTYGSEYYPARLFDIQNPPPVLYYKGRIERIGSGACITCVGSRECSESGYNSAYSLGYKIAAAGICIITGGATGIDTAFTLGALDSGGFSVAVLGSGINILYPFDNSPVFARLIKSGLVITEFSPYTEPRGANFPIRNRVLAALGEALLVGESGACGGAMITAQYAMDNGKKIFVIPSDISNPRAEGSNSLLKTQATPVTNAADVIKFFEYGYPKTVHSEHFATDDGIAGTRRKKRKARAEITARAKKLALSKSVPDMQEPPPEKRPAPESFSDVERAVYDALGFDGKSADQIGRDVSLSQSDVLSALTMLEIYGYATSLAGGLYKII